MRSLVLLTKFLFSMNPIAVVHYNSPSILALFGLCLGLIVLSFVLKYWRKRMVQSNSRKLTQSWSSMSLWFGIVGLLLIVARVERIQVLAMPFLWVVWGLALLILAFIQWRLFRSRYYELLPRSATPATDPYLPGKRRR